MPKIAVFLGPSLDVGEAESILDATYLPPAKRDDLSNLASEFRIVGLIDGTFFHTLAVSPKEVVAALGRGVRVYGAASMGALRAVETSSCGMIGLGEVFAMYRDGVIDSDDEVALTYEAETFKATSEPLVNIRFALAKAVKADLITQATSDEVLDTLKRLYFPLRSYQRVAEICPSLREFLRCENLNVKANDARGLLRRIKQDIERTALT
jgi:TfuA protein